MAAKLSTPTTKFDLRQNADINVTPFVDVMLVLLIIFMVAAPMATKSLKMELSPSSPNPAPVQKPIWVSVEPAGRILIVDRETSLKQLAADLTRSIEEANPGVREPRDERVMLRGSRGVAYRDFVGVLNQLQNDGFKKVGLVSEDL